MAGCGTKRKRKSKSGKKKRRTGSCRALDTSEAGWYGEVAVSACKDFKSDPVPCRYLPYSRVREYAKACEIKGRSSKSKAQLCAALARRNHKKAVSQKCGLRRMAQIYAARAGDPNYNGPEFYNTNVMRQILKRACIYIPPRASSVVLRDIVSRCVGAMEAEKRQHIHRLAEIKLGGEQRLLDLKRADRAQAATSEEKKRVKEDMSDQRKDENTRHKEEMKALMECGREMAEQGSRRSSVSEEEGPAFE